jgi:hypothetical protein
VSVWCNFVDDTGRVVSVNSDLVRIARADEENTVLVFTEYHSVTVKSRLEDVTNIFTATRTTREMASTLPTPRSRRAHYKWATHMAHTLLLPRLAPV